MYLFCERHYYACGTVSGYASSDLMPTVVRLPPFTRANFSGLSNLILGSSFANSSPIAATIQFCSGLFLFALERLPLTHFHLHIALQSSWVLTGYIV